jgi:hypothetical protein
LKYSQILEMICLSSAAYCHSAYRLVGLSVNLLNDFIIWCSLY